MRTKVTVHFIFQFLILSRTDIAKFKLCPKMQVHFILQFLILSRTDIAKFKLCPTLDVLIIMYKCMKERPFHMSRRNPVRFFLPRNTSQRVSQL